MSLKCYWMNFFGLHRKERKLNEKYNSTFVFISTTLLLMTITDCNRAVENLSTVFFCLTKDKCIELYLQNCRKHLLVSSENFCCEAKTSGSRASRRKISFAKPACKTIHISSLDWKQCDSRWSNAILVDKWLMIKDITDFIIFWNLNYIRFVKETSKICQRQNL